jgi:hypothetical protein
MTRFALAGIAALVAVSAFPFTAQAQNRVKVGTLDCQMSGGVGLIVTSRKELLCRFIPSARGWRGESYARSRVLASISARPPAATWSGRSMRRPALAAMRLPEAMAAPVRKLPSARAWVRTHSSGETTAP